MNKPINQPFFFDAYKQKWKILVEDFYYEDLDDSVRDFATAVTLEDECTIKLHTSLLEDKPVMRRKLLHELTHAFLVADGETYLKIIAGRLPGNPQEEYLRSINELFAFFVENHHDRMHKVTEDFMRNLEKGNI